MNLRKILASFLAGAVAMSSMVFTSVTASAAEDPVLPNVEYGNVKLEKTGEHTFTLADDGSVNSSILQVQSTATGGTYTFASTDIVLLSVTTDEADTTNWVAAVNGFTSSWGGWSGVQGNGLVLSTTVGDIMKANNITDIANFGGFIYQVWNAPEGATIKYSLLLAEASSEPSDLPEPVLPDVAYGAVKLEKTGEHTFALADDGSVNSSILQVQATSTGGAFTFAATDVVLLSVTTNEADTTNWVAAVNGFTSSWGGWSGVQGNGLVLSTTVGDIMKANSITNIADFGGFIYQVWNAPEGAKVRYSLLLAEGVASSTYAITIDSAIENGTVTTDVDEAAKGDTVTITAEPANGYSLSAVTVTTESGSDVEVADDNTFTMPDEAVTVSASFDKATYSIAIDDAVANGTVTTAVEDAAEGDTVTVTATPADGYVLDAIKVTGDSGDAVTVSANGTFTMPSEAVTVSAAFKPIAVTGVELDRTTASVLVDGTVTLVATVSPEDALDTSVTWSSSDDSIAKVDANGKVTGVSAGKATITVKTTDGGFEAICTVTVTEEDIAVESITFDKTAVELEEGATATITATVLPEDATYDSITWTSSDTTVATVANGKITAVAAGTATITAAIGNIKATCEVTVTAVAVESITLSEDTLILEVGDTGVLTATVSPEDAAYDSITWTSSNDEIATVDDGVITAVAAGSVTITAAIGDVTAECDVTITEAPESTGFDKVDADFEADTIVAQTATVVDEETGEVTTSNRFVMMVSEDDIESKDTVTFTLSNGTTTKTVTVSKYYTSLSASGDVVAPADGYVFLALTITDIPEGITVTCTDVALS